MKSEKCRKRTRRTLAKAKPPRLIGAFMKLKPASATALFIAAKCRSCGKCPDMPPITPPPGFLDADVLRQWQALQG